MAWFETLNGNVSTSQQEGVSAIHWGAIWYFALSNLDVIRGNQDSENYCVIFQCDLLTFAVEFHGKSWTFPQDRASTHRSISTTAFLREQIVTVLPWLAKYPDSNIIKNLFVAFLQGLFIRRDANSITSEVCGRLSIQSEPTNMMTLFISCIVQLRRGLSKWWKSTTAKCTSSLWDLIHDKHFRLVLFFCVRKMWSYSLSQLQNHRKYWFAIKTFSWWYKIVVLWTGVTLLI